MMGLIFHYLSIWRSWNGLKRHTRCCLMLRFLLELNSTIYMGSILRHHTAFGNTSIWLFCWKCSMIVFISVPNFILQVCVSWYFFIHPLIFYLSQFCSYGSEETPVTDIQDLRFIQVIFVFEGCSNSHAVVLEATSL